MSEQSEAVAVKRGPGRPRACEPRSTVSVWLPASAHDRLIELAKRHEMSISATIRQLLIIRLPQ